jgi:hypothetical protein
MKALSFCCLYTITIVFSRSKYIFALVPCCQLSQPTSSLGVQPQWIAARHSSTDASREAALGAAYREASMFCLERQVPLRIFLYTESARLRLSFDGLCLQSPSRQYGLRSIGPRLNTVRLTKNRKRCPPLERCWLHDCRCIVLRLRKRSLYQHFMAWPFRYQKQKVPPFFTLSPTNSPL